MKTGFALFLLLTSFRIHGQSHFIRTYGLGSLNEGKRVIQTSDKGFAIAGTATPYSGGQTDFYLLKTDSSGIPEFQYSYGGIGIDHATSLVQFADSGYLLAGYTNSSTPNNDYDIQLVRTDKSGSLLWSKTFGTSGWDFIYDMKPSFDGNYILAGNSYGSGNGLSSGLVVKIDPDGNVIWQKFVEQNLLVTLNRIAVRSDGSFVACGDASNVVSHPLDGLVVFFDSNGDSLRTVRVDNGYFESLKGVGFFSNGDLALSGITIDSADSDNKDQLIMRMDGNGNTVWYYQQFHSGEDEFTDLVVKDDSLIAVGSTSSFGFGNHDFHINKFDGTGLFASGHTFGGTQNDFCYNLISTEDGGFALVGNSTSFGPGQQCVLLIKSDSLFSYLQLSGVVIPVPEIKEKALFSVYPNPSNGLFTINCGKVTERGLLKIYDISGSVLYERSINSCPFTVDLDFSPGAYVAELNYSGDVQRLKILISR